MARCGAEDAEFSGPAMALPLGDGIPLAVPFRLLSHPAPVRTNGVEGRADGLVVLAICSDFPVEKGSFMDSNPINITNMHYARPVSSQLKTSKLGVAFPRWTSLPSALSFIPLIVPVPLRDIGRGPGLSSRQASLA